MTRKVQKADKLVSSATSIFGKALAKVMKANDLINAHIETQLSLNDQDQAKIENIKYSIEDRASKIDQSKQLINKNNELAEKLKQFV